MLLCEQEHRGLPRHRYLSHRYLLRIVERYRHGSGNVFELHLRDASRIGLVAI